MQVPNLPKRLAKCSWDFLSYLDRRWSLNALRCMVTLGKLDRERGRQRSKMFFFWKISSKIVFDEKEYYQ